ncbi:MAG TPA: SDR family oxidoreductase [Saprospiraceae bacterium]|nr:SDR family oxidoreductase [Saprospiraceae bacterium]
MPLSNKTAYITGGSKGIGFGIAMALLEQGMNVAISGRSMNPVQAAAKKLSTDAHRILPLVSDVRKLEDEKTAVRHILDKWGKLDVLVANAGVGHFAPIDTITPAQWNETIDTNLTGVFHSVKASLEALKASEGYIITIASLAGTNFFPAASAYNASKFGLVGFTQAMMLDLRYYGIKVTTIMPGSVSSYFNDRIPSEADAWKIQPEDIGQMVADLLKMPPRTLPSKIEVRPTRPPQN